MEAEPVDNQKTIEDEFLTFKTLGTLAGSVAATWLVCNTISSLFPPEYLTHYQWRYIALAISEVISLYLTYRSIKRGPDKWVLGFLNGLLIFVNVSGLNAISTGTRLFTGPDETKRQADTNRVANNRVLNKAILLPFTKEISWWPDIGLLDKVSRQDSIIEVLSQAKTKPAAIGSLYQAIEVRAAVYDSIGINALKIYNNESPVLQDTIIVNGRLYKLTIDYLLFDNYKNQKSTCYLKINATLTPIKKLTKEDYLLNNTDCPNRQQTNLDQSSTMIYSLYNSRGKKVAYEIHLTPHVRSFIPITIKAEIGDWSKSYAFKYRRMSWSQL